jgi:hypothetical protein
VSSSASSRAAVRRSAALVLIVASATLTGCAGHSDRSALSDAADSLRSQASEGALLADEAMSGQVTGIFIHEHASDLYDEASKTHASLEGTRVDPSLASELAGLQALSGRVADDLQALSTTSADAGQLAVELRQTAEAVHRIGEPPS